MPRSIGYYPALCQSFGDGLLVGGPKGVVALDGSSGQRLWLREDLRGIEQVAVAATQGLMVMATEDALLTLDLASGATRWSRPIPRNAKGILTVSLATTNGVAYFLLPMDREHWRLHAIPLEQELPGASDPTPFLLGTHVVSCEDWVLAFGIEEFRAYDVRPLSDNAHRTR